MLPARIFYHVYAGGAWSQPVAEFFGALADSRIPGSVTVGLVGDPADRGKAREIITGRARPRRVTWAEAGEGFEQVTLRVLQREARRSATERAYLYCHAKGSYDDTDYNTAWRRSMTKYLVGCWRDCLELLELGHDTVGCHWLTPERDNAPPGRPVSTPFYGGNFWWAKTSYLRQLPPVGEENRHDAEAWIGLGDPIAADLLPGWPERQLFGC